MSDVEFTKAIQVGVKAVDQINKQCNIEDLDSLKERMEEQQLDLEEKQDFFIKAGQIEDADDLLNELDELEADLVKSELEGLSLAPLRVESERTLVGKPKGPQSEEEKELADLERMMA